VTSVLSVDASVVVAAAPQLMRSWTGVQGATYYLIQNMSQFRQFYAELRRQKIIAVDTETTSLDWVRARVCGFVFGWGIDNNYYLPIAHQTDEAQLSVDDIRDDLRAVLEDASVTKIFWNKCYDQHMLQREGIGLRGPCHDGVPQVHLLDENVEKALKDVSCSLIDKNADKWEKALHKWRDDESKRRRKEFSRIIKATLDKTRTALEAEMQERDPMWRFSGKTKAQITNLLKQKVKEKLSGHPFADAKKTDITYDLVPLDVMTPYACADVHYTWMNYKSLLPSIAGHDALRGLYLNEMELVQAIYEVEDNGVLIDVSLLNKLEPTFEKAMADAEREVYAAVGYEFKIDSNQELLQALRKAGCTLTKLTKKGKENLRNGIEVSEDQYSVDKEVLEELAAEYEFAAKVIEFRDKQKLLNTYVRAIRELVDSNHYLHSSFNPNVSTGRMSSHDPNVQNIPGKNLDIRRAFVIPGFEDPKSSEYVFVFADYSQMELRLTAHWSNDPTLVAAYAPTAPGWIGKEQDVHSITCADVVLQRPLDEVLRILKDESHPEYNDIKWYRNIAKRVNFGIIYGAGPFAIQRQVSTPKRKVSADACKAYIKKYFQRYRGVKAWIDSTELQMRRQGFLQNTFGRFRRLPKIHSAKKWEQGRAARQGVNFLIQGDAADIFKHAVVRVRRILKKHNARTRIVNFVHDEIQFYWHKEELGLMGEVKKAMEDFDFRVPIVVDFARSWTNWAAKKELKH